MKYGKARELVESAIEQIDEADGNPAPYGWNVKKSPSGRKRYVPKTKEQWNKESEAFHKKNPHHWENVERFQRELHAKYGIRESAIEALDERANEMSPVPNRPSIRDRIMNPFNLPWRPNYKPPSRPTTKPNPNDPIHHGFDPYDIQTPTNIDKPGSTPTGPARKSTSSRKATGKVGSRGKVGSPSAAMGAGGAKGSVASPSAAVGIAEGLLSRINRRG